MCLTCAFINPFGGDWLHNRTGERSIDESGLPGGDVPDGTDTTVTLMSGDTFTGSVAAGGDTDWFILDLIAGTTYTITMTPGTLGDAVVSLRNVSGSTIDFANNEFEGGTETLTFTAPEAGVAYVVATSFSNLVSPGNPIFGTDVGTYTLTLTAVEGPPPPPPEVPPPPPPPETGTPLDAITWGYTAPSVIDVYFAPGDVLFSDTIEGISSDYITSGWSEFEIERAMAAFGLFENIANLTFNRVTDPTLAEFFMVEVPLGSSLGYWNVGGGPVTLDGTGYTPAAGHGVFFNEGAGWNTLGLEQGGYGFVTLIHEIGHGLGLAHPHDDGGTSAVMPGTANRFLDMGPFNLNQGIFTMMSYVDGWRSAPHGPSPSLSWGYQGTPMAFDVAVLQALYGANTGFATGDDMYVMPTENGAGTFYAAIWDAGGVDTIVHRGNAAAVIDLREAPLTYTENGGGYVSHVADIHGGFTIAAGAVIENAIGGSGDDRMTGNGADNDLQGNQGNDTLYGGDGADTLMGGAGFDRLDGGNDADLLSGGAQADNLFGDAGNDTLEGGLGNDRLFGGADNDSLMGEEGNDLLRGDAGNDTLDGGAGEDRLFGGSGFDRLQGGDGDDQLSGGAQADNLFGDAGNDTLDGGDGFDRLFGGAGNDLLTGGNGPDALFGELGNDTLIGGADNDRLFGGAGFDRIEGGAGNDEIWGNFNADTFVFADGHGNDTIRDFDALNPFERIDLSGITALSGIADYDALFGTGAVSSDGGGVMIDTGGGNSIFLAGVLVANLDNSDFIFA